jgi:hypothetical protein
MKIKVNWGGVEQELVCDGVIELDGRPYVPPPAPEPRVWEVEIGLAATMQGTPYAWKMSKDGGAAMATITLEFTDGRAWVKPTQRAKEVAKALRDDVMVGHIITYKLMLEAADLLDGGHK